MFDTKYNSGISSFHYFPDKLFIQKII